MKSCISGTQIKYKSASSLVCWQNEVIKFGSGGDCITLIYSSRNTLYGIQLAFIFTASTSTLLLKTKSASFLVITVSQT